MATETDNLVEVVRRLERQPLRNIVLLKHIEAFREHVSVAQVSDGSDTATLVLLDTTGKPLRSRDLSAGGIRRAHIERPSSPDPTAAQRRAGLRAMSCSSSPAMTIATSSPNAFRSAGPRASSPSPATSMRPLSPTSEVSVSTSASDSVLRLFESQGHPRDWLLPLLASDRAFVCVLEQDGGAPLGLHRLREPSSDLGGRRRRDADAASWPGLRGPRGANGVGRTATPQAGRAVSGE